MDTQDRAAVVRFYDEVYQASRGVASQWNGDTAACLPGTNSLEYSEATILRVNYFRAMAGLPADVVLKVDWSEGCQAAALCCAAANRVSHFITSDWPCYTAAAAASAATSNLLIGDRGPTAIDLYLDDSGPENSYVGHRRWVLYPPQKAMGTASVPSAAPHFGVNVLRVIGGHGPRPAVPESVMWPPSGFVPFQIIPRRSGRWSFSLPGADFSGAQVTMSQAGAPVALTVEPLHNDRGVADNTLVWRPEGVPIRAPAEDLRYSVRIQGVRVDGVPRDFDYDVVIIDPANSPPQPPRIVRQPADQVVIEGAPASFDVEATGTSPLTYQWHFEGSPLQGETGVVLRLPAATLAQSGTYQVRVADAGGDVLSQPARLTVNPAVTELRLSIERLAENQAVLRWEASATLQRTSELSAGWEDLPASSPFTIPLEGTAVFFRLRGQ